MSKSMITIQGKLLPNTEQQSVLDIQCRKWSSCMRYAYQRLLEGQERKDLKRELPSIFNINTRYADDAILFAQSTISSLIELEEDPKKVIWGSKKLFKQLCNKGKSKNQKKQIKEKFREKRQGQLYSRGDKSKKGNPNIRLIEEDNKYYFRINTGTRQWILVEFKCSHKKWNDFLILWQQGDAYSVRLQKKNGEYFAHISFKETLVPISINLNSGCIGLDLNAFPSHIAWTETNSDGNYLSHGNINTNMLFDQRTNKRNYYIWQYAYKIINIAIQKHMG